MQAITQAEIPGWRNFFFRCFAASLLLHLLAAYFSVGYQYQDEQSQIMEFAGYKLGMVPASRLSWEFADQIRQGIQPFIVVVVYKALQLLGLANPFLCSLILRILSALLGWASILLLTRELSRYIASAFWRKFLVLLSCFIWMLPYIQAHFSCESISGSLFFLGIAGILVFQRKPVTDKNRTLLLLLSGTAVGLSFVVRNQTVFMVFGLGMWMIFIGRFSFKNILLFGSAGLMMIGLGIVIDYWFYSKWVFSSYNYFHINLVKDKVSEFGVTPFYFYFYIYYLNLVPPFSIFIMGTIVYAWYRYPRHILTWVCVPFLLGHSLIGHKEIRFLFPMVDAIPMLLVLPFHKLDVRRINRKWALIPVYVMGGLNIFLLLIVCLKPANNAFGLYKFLYSYTETHGRTVLLSNVHDPYDMIGATINFHKPEHITIHALDSLGYLSAAPDTDKSGNTLVVIDNTALADSFEHTHPGIPRLYKSLPHSLNYLSFRKEDMQQIWYVYRIR